MWNRGDERCLEFVPPEREGGSVWVWWALSPPPGNAQKCSPVSFTHPQTLWAVQGAPAVKGRCSVTMCVQSPSRLQDFQWRVLHHSFCFPLVYLLCWITSICIFRSLSHLCPRRLTFIYLQVELSQAEAPEGNWRQKNGIWLFMPPPPACRVAMGWLPSAPLRHTCSVMITTPTSCFVRSRVVMAPHFC